jgi:hypothetical protein
MKVHRDRQAKKIWLTQPAYIERVIERFGTSTKGDTTTIGSRKDDALCRGIANGSAYVSDIREAVAWARSANQPVYVLCTEYSSFPCGARCPNPRAVHDVPIPVRCTVCQSPCGARCANPRAPSNSLHHSKKLSGACSGAGCTRPDISFAASFLARQIARPTEHLWKMALGVVAYLSNTRTVGLILGVQRQEATRGLGRCGLGWL